MLSDAKRIARLMLDARKRSGQSQEELAELLNVSISTVQRLESAKRAPTLENFIEWYRALGMNWFRDMLRLANPELYCVFDGSTADVEQRRNGLFKYLADCPPGEVDKLAFLIFGQHGSDWPSMLDEYVANAHCSMRSRAAVCRLVIENYELEAATGDLVDPETAKPNIGNLRSAHIAGQKAAQLKRSEYSR
uniref:Helix-turn-helix domain protein n=1 Tax=Myoviridae sp. ctuev19 TaxID=2827716 RepID=A0A8S5SF85_9CAUD|nr:MAG TPA: helix-turn-helix domain protein [Myoviridae sp. ctuev19]